MSVTDMSFAEVRRLWSEVQEAFGDTIAWNMLLGWQIELDTGPPAGDPLKPPKRIEAMIEIVDVEPERSEIVIGTLGGKTRKLKLDTIEMSPEFSYRYGGQWFPPCEMLGFFVHKALVAHHTRISAPPVTLPAPPITEAIRPVLGERNEEREAACLARLAGNHMAWSSDVAFSDEGDAAVWARLIRDIYGMRDSGVLSTWEREFAGSLVPKSYQPSLILSPKQKGYLVKIANKILRKSDGGRIVP